MSSIAAALTAATMGTPADVIKTRVMNQPLDNTGRGTRKLNEIVYVSYLLILSTTLLVLLFLTYVLISGIYYHGSFDCLKKTVMHEGCWALYKGFVPCWLRMAPWSMTFWLSFEKFRNILGVETW